MNCWICTTHPPPYILAAASKSEPEAEVKAENEEVKSEPTEGEVKQEADDVIKTEPTETESEKKYVPSII